VRISDEGRNVLGQKPVMNDNYTSRPATIRLPVPQ
jgi:hypothetical protein